MLPLLKSCSKGCAGRCVDQGASWLEFVTDSVRNARTSRLPGTLQTPVLCSRSSALCISACTSPAPCIERLPMYHTSLLWKLQVYHQHRSLRRHGSRTRCPFPSTQTGVLPLRCCVALYPIQVAIFTMHAAATIVEHMRRTQRYHRARNMLQKPLSETLCTC